MVQAELAEAVFFGWVDACTVCGGADFVDRDRHPQRRVGLPPHVLVEPVVLGISPVHDRVERGVDLFAGE